MSLKDHERARTLIRARQVEGISGSEGQWLDAHLAACDACSSEARAVTDAIAAMRMVRVTVPAEAVRRTTLAVHRRIERRRSQHRPVGFLCAAAAISSLWAIVTTPYTWDAFAQLGRMIHLPDMVWQTGFLLWWFLPATVLSAVAAWQHVSRTDWRSI
jgi:hypothetical protein